MTAAVYESFFTHSREALCVIDSSGRVHHANGAFLVVLGRAEAEVVGQRCADLIHPDDAARADARIAALIAQRERGTFDARWRHPDGTYRWLSWQADPNGEMLYCRLRAVSIADEPLTQTVCEALPCPAFAVDERGICLLSNAANCRILERPQNEVVGRSLDELPYPFDLRVQLQEHAARVFATGEPALVREVFLPGPGGHSSWAQIRMVGLQVGSKRIVLVVAEDISERRAAETALGRSESSFRRLIEGAPDAIFVHRGGTIVYANANAARILAYQDPVDLVDVPFRELVFVEDRAVLDGFVSSAPELRMVRRDGMVIYVEATVHFVDFDGLEATLIFARDVTERRKIQQQLHHADRMMSIGTLAAGVAHEINNPLSYVIANLDHMRRTVAEIVALVGAGDARALRDRVDELAPALQDAESGARRVREIVGDLSTFSNPQEDLRRSVDVRHVLDSAVHMAMNEIRHRAELVRELGDVPLVLGSDQRLAQVLLNLIVNAVQALPEGGSNQIRLVTRTSAAGAAVVEIHDSGAGIEASVLDRVFDPFYTTKPVGVGTGLGLSICHAIIDAHGGSIELESKPGRGTVARVTLPAAVAANSTRPTTQTPRPSGRRLSILIIDDEPPIGRVLQKLFAREHNAQVAHSGEEALALLAHENYDAVFCDLMMPKMPGSEVYERVKATRPELAEKFVFMTGGAFTRSAREFLSGSTNPVVIKPFDFAEVRRVIARMMAKNDAPST